MACSEQFHPWLARRHQLVPSQWLSALIDGRQVAAAPSAGWRLFEIGSDDGAAFAKGHVPGAGYIDIARFEEAPLWNKVADPALLRLLLDNGIACDTAVVLYGRHSLAVARVAHLMLYAGVRDVRLLDGGLAAWTRAGLSLAIGLPRRYPAIVDFGCAFPAHPEYLIDIDEARNLLRQHDGALVSVRTWDEFRGKTSGYSYIVAKGDIPGARWGRAGDNGDVDSMSAYQNPDGTMKHADEILAFWRESDIYPHQRVAFYCGTGWRASLAFFYAWLMGWERISIYDGGWYEWSNMSGMPAPYFAASLPVR